VNQKKYLPVLCVLDLSPYRNSFRGSWRTGCTWADLPAAFSPIESEASLGWMCCFVRGPDSFRAAEGQRLGVRQLWLANPGAVNRGVFLRAASFSLPRKRVAMGE